VLKVLIADDDFGMRLVLNKIINKIEGVELIGEVEDGREALKLFEEVKPDIIFLDIEMPGLNGLECAKRIFDINPKTIIIFATAHEEFMSEAFEVYAFDYLVKPFHIERIKKTLKRIINNTGDANNNVIEKTIYHKKNVDKLIIKNKEGMCFIDIDNIILIQREERSTVIYTRDNRYITSENLGNIEERLNKTSFFRSHKSYIINISKINRIYPYGRWTYIIKFKECDKDALITHKKYAELEKIFMI
jgi:two-component system LytT family response regulator